MSEIHRSTSSNEGGTTISTQTWTDGVVAISICNVHGDLIARTTQTYQDVQEQAFAVLRHFGITEVVVPLEVGQVWHSHHNPNLTRTITCVTDDMVAYTVDDGYGDVYPLIRTHEHLRTYSLPAPEETHA